jgi:hypothetical protein
MTTWVPPIHQLQASVGRLILTALPLQHDSTLKQLRQDLTWDMASQMRLRFEKSGNVSQIFLSLTRTTRFIKHSPNFALQEIDQGCNWQPDAEDITHLRTQWKF